MYKSFLFTLIISSIFLSINVFGQESSSIQLNGGMIFPVSASNGFAGSLEFNYSFNKKLSLYIYSGYSAWGKNRVVFHEDWSVIQKQQYFDSYSNDNNILVPIFIGCKLNLYKNRIFTMFGLLEAGYSHLKYDRYANIKKVDPSTGEVLAFNVDPGSRTPVTENLFGAGIGIGLFHPLTKNLNINLTFKYNLLGNSKYSSLISTGKTYTTLLIGLGYSL